MSVETEAFAAMLRELKERSGRSYGALATRLHVSTSTLHRYCNGAAVPAEYAPVERLARACGAGAEELVELHRRWILADAARRRESSSPGARAASAPSPAPEPAAGSVPKPLSESAPGPTAEPVSETDVVLEEVKTVSPVPHAPPSAEPGRRARRRMLLSATAVAVLAAAVSALVLHNAGGTPGPSAAVPSSAATVPTGTAPAGTGVTAPPAAAPSTAAPSATAPPETIPFETTPPETTPAPTASATPERIPAPFHVNVLTDNWGSPCGQWFLSPRTPAKVSPPPDSTARIQSWAAAQQAVPAGHLRLQLAAQGTSATPVVLLGVNVHVVSARPAPKGNAYTPGSGCGGELTPASFAVDLDATPPRAVPAPGREGTRKTAPTDFPYRVSNSDPQVIEVDATTRSQDVSWYLDLVWSSGGEQSTLTVDDNGKPFRTAGLRGAPGYFHNGTAWAPSPTED
ncbi:helix-turn-helix transcriptional regulator [Kitasatospora sp. NPDC036755]|uniref:helix-turn-helix domain-containing protein n=1 Tax=Kitasatospora sp. NPDC036755 TaxID=3154600 RepID=UPI0033FE65F8